jgi:mannose-6-phosphate isomerase-like protein (cupin superfamily)
MSEFTHTNLMEIENQAGDRTPGFEARLARTHIESEHLGVSYFRFPPGYRVPFGHRHREQEEAYVIVEGSGRMRLGDEVIALKEWDVVRVTPSLARAIESGPDGLAYIAIGSDRPEGGDGERVADFWTD